MGWSNTKITKHTHPAEWALIKLAFPGYKKRSATLTMTDNLALTGRHWDGGSKSEYVILPVCDRVIPHTPGNVAFVDLTDGTQVVQCGIFCGQPGLAHLYRKTQPENVDADVVPFLETV